jgi:hypothetical protein
MAFLGFLGLFWPFLGFFGLFWPFFDFFCVFSQKWLKTSKFVKMGLVGGLGATCTLGSKKWSFFSGEIGGIPR